MHILCFSPALLCVAFFLLAHPSRMYSQWTPQGVGILPLNYEIWGLSAVNEQVAWGVAFDVSANQSVPLTHIGRVVRTTDGGQTWKVYEVEEAIGRVSWDIQAFDSLTAWITAQDYNNGKGRGLFKTTDGGVTWTQKFSGVEGGVWLRFFDPQSGIAINREYVATTTDGGETWNKSTISGFNTNEYTLLTSGTNSCAIKGNYIWFGTSNGRVLRSKDRGKTWAFFSSGQGSAASIESVAFRDTLNGMAVSSRNGSYTRLVTNNGGQTWTALPGNVNAGSINNIAYIPGTAETYIGGTSFISVATTRLSAYTLDSGQGWKKINSGINFSAFAFVNEKTGWATQGFGINSNRTALYKWNGNPFVSAIEWAGGNIRVEVFPNPVSEYLTLQREGAPLPANTIVSLFDVQGHLVFSQSFDGHPLMLDHLTPGLYLLQIEAEGRRGVTKVVKQP